MNPTSRLVWLGASVFLLGALPAARAAVLEEGAVTVSPGTTDVGFPSQTTNDGTLRITPPSSLTTITLNVARSLRTVHGRVLIDGASMTVSQNATIAETGVGSLEITTGGLFDASQLTIGGTTSSGSGAEGSVLVQGDGSKLVARNRIVVGEFGVAELLVADGAALLSGVTTTAAQAIIGNSFGSNGVATVTGADSSWEHNGSLIVGQSGNAQLNILDGARVNSLTGSVAASSGENSSVGSVAIDGAGSRWTTEGLTIGDRGAAEIRVTNGGVLDVSNNGKTQTVIGRQSNSYGRLIVSGPASRWIDSQTAIFGQSGVGELVIDDGAFVVTTGAILGQSVGEGLARITGATTRWQLGSLQVGQSTGRGTLEITDGATVAVSFGSQPLVGASGRIKLDNGKLTFSSIQQTSNAGVIEGDGVITGRLTNLSTGLLRVNQGDYLRLAGSEHSQQGRVQVFGGELEWNDALVNASIGVVTAEGATLRSRGNVGLNNNGSLLLTGGTNRLFGNVTNAGTTLVTSGQATFYDRLTNTGLISTSPGTTVTVLGAMSGKGIAGDGNVFLEGQVSPGASPGAMNFGAGVHLGAASRLNIEIAGTVAGENFDQLSAEDTVYLGGALHLEALAGLGASATLTIVTAGELVGSFNSVPEMGANLGFGVKFNGITYDYAHDEVRVSLLQGMAADLDANGSVDGVDFLMWQQNAGATVEHVGVGPDVNGDGVVDEADLAVWATAAATPAQNPVQTAVPEPGGAALFVVGFVAVGFRFSSGRRRL